MLSLHRATFALLAFSSLASIVAPACTTAEDDGGPSNTSAPASSSGQGGTLAGEVVHVTVEVTHAVSLEPLEGAMVCVLDTPTPCVASDPDGHATVLTRANSDVWITIELENYVSALIGVRTLFQPALLSAPILPSGISGIIASSAGTTLEPGKGHMVMVSVGQPVGATYPRIAGTRFGLIPASGQGPFYTNATNTGIEPMLMETGPGGAGILFNVEPGDATLVATNDTHACEALLAIPQGNADNYKVKILPDHVTYTNVLCQPLPPGTGGGGSGGNGGNGGMGGAGGSIGGSGGAGGN